jgi:ATP-dependent helicase/nuclease subunit B
LLETHSLDIEVWLKKVELVLDQAIAKAYLGLSRKVVDEESEVLLAFWRYLTNVGDPVIRKHLAMADHLQLVKMNSQGRSAIHLGADC